MSKSRNPYRDGSNYSKVFAKMLKSQVFTKAQVVGMFKSDCKLNDSASLSSGIVLLSPRIDTLGNASAKGKVYFVEKLNRKEVKGVKDEQKFRVRYTTPARNKALGIVEEVKDSVQQVKTAKKVTVKKTPAKKPAKVAHALQAVA
ncbi:MAG: hypothetical protein WC375_00075 [Methanomassiliicoccales archaeon]|jgi:hypothetical protein